MEPKRAKVLTPAKFFHLLRVTDATSRFPERDTLVLLLGRTQQPQRAQDVREPSGSNRGIRLTRCSCCSVIRT
jgi:hypothetical protein